MTIFTSSIDFYAKQYLLLCDSAVFRKLLTFDEAKRTIEANFKPTFLGEEETVLLEAYNRVVNADVISQIDLPSFNTSIIDGYAVHSEDTLGAGEEQPVQLKVVGCIVVGEEYNLKLNGGEAVEIAAGALLPEGADAVISIDDCEREDNSLQVYASVALNDNLRKKGSDIKKSSVVLKKGQVLGPSEIGVLASLGLKQIKVLKIPIVAVLSVGNDVCELSETLTAGKTYDLNAYSLCAAVMECGGKPVYFGVVPEEKESILRVLRTAVASADMVIACGSEPDVTLLIDSLGEPGLVINGVAIKPGKSMALAFVDEKPVFLLPNNPSAALLTYNLFARSYVYRLAGRPASVLKTLVGFSGSKMFGAKGSRTFLMVKLEFDRSCRLIAEPIEVNGPVSALAVADGFVEIGENEQFIEVDKQVAVTLLRGSAGRV